MLVYYLKSQLSIFNLLVVVAQNLKMINFKKHWCKEQHSSTGVIPHRPGFWTEETEVSPSRCIPQWLPASLWAPSLHTCRSLGLEVASKMSALLLGHGEISGPHRRGVRGRWRTSSYQRHVLISRISSKKSCVVHVLRHWGIGDSRSRRVQAALAAYTAAVAAEAVQVSVVGVLRAYPPGPWIERVLLIYVIVISFSAGDLSQCSGNGTKHDSKGTGSKDGEQAEI